MVALSPSSTCREVWSAGQRVRLSPEQVTEVAKLAETDRAVRAHEQAHLAAAGPYSLGGPSYTYSPGPDGRLYAVAGEVSLDVSADSSDPERTIEKARAVQAAANAPPDPSGQDRAVAAAAAQMEAAAQQELAASRPAPAEAAYGAPETGRTGQVLSLVL